MRNSELFWSAAGLTLLLAVSVPAPAQSGEKPLTQDELLLQIESLPPAASDPGRRTPAVMPVPGSAGRTAVRPTSSSGPDANALFPGAADVGTPKPEKKRKGATQIEALEATFDQKAHIAVFTGDVVVTDPEFNVRADKLTAYLKSADDAQAAPPPSTRLQIGGAPESKPRESKPGIGGGLERALAEANDGGMVVVTQEKLEADGSTSRSIGRGRKVLYDSATGDITLYGRPDVQQGINTCVATEEGTVMVLNRDGHMRVTGAHKTVIKDQGELKK